MLGGLVQAGTKALGGERFSLVSVLPATLLVGYAAFLAASGVYAGRRVSLGSLPMTLGHNAGWAVLAVFGIFVISVLLRPLQIVLVWTLEGYWDHTPILKWLEPLAIERHQRRRHTADVIAGQGVNDSRPSTTLRSIVEERQRFRRHSIRRAKAEERVGRYPEDRPSDEIRLMPTMLGNALRKGEDDAGDRYGLDFTAIAPRLYPHLSDKIAAEIVRNLDIIEGGAALTTAFVLAAAISIPLFWRGDAWTLAAPAALVLGLFAYLGTLRIAREHGRLLATAVDLHRFDMVAKLHYKLPATVHEEWEFNAMLSLFLRSESSEARDIMKNYGYVHGPELPAPASAAKPGPLDDGSGAPAEPAG